MTTLEEAKAHLRVTHDMEDDYIHSLIEAAEGHVSQYLGDDLMTPMPGPVKAAVLLLVGDLYENRQKHFDRITYDNNTYDLLLKPYRSMVLQ